MKEAIGTLVRTINIVNRPFAVALPEGTFLVWKNLTNFLEDKKNLPPLMGLDNHLDVWISNQIK